MDARTATSGCVAIKHGCSYPKNMGDDFAGRRLSLSPCTARKTETCHQVQFRASSRASGICFSRLELTGKLQVKKMLLLK